MTAVIIDDEPAICTALSGMLNFYCPTVRVKKVAHSLKTAVEAIQEHEPDVLFLDVKMPDGSGFDLLDQLPGYQGSVVFVTAHGEFAIEAVRVRAVDYLLKPVNPDQLIQAVKQAGQQQRLQPEQRIAQPVNNTDVSSRKLILKKEDAVHVLNLDDILHCRSDGNYTWFYTRNGDGLLIAKTLKHFEPMLVPHGFFKVHRSHVINMHAVHCFEKRDGGMVRLENGQTVPVASRKRDAFLEALYRLK